MVKDRQKLLELTLSDKRVVSEQSQIYLDTLHLPPDYLPSDESLEFRLGTNEFDETRTRECSLSTNQTEILCEFYNEILAGVNSKVKLDAIKSKYSDSGVTGFDDFLENMTYAWSWENRINTLEDFKSKVLDQFSLLESKITVATEDNFNLVRRIRNSNAKALNKINSTGFSYIVNATSVHDRLFNLDNFYKDEEFFLEAELCPKQTETYVGLAFEGGALVIETDPEDQEVGTNLTLATIIADAVVDEDNTKIDETTTHDDDFGTQGVQIRKPTLEARMSAYNKAPQSASDVYGEIGELMQTLPDVDDIPRSIHDYLIKRLAGLREIGLSQNLELSKWYGLALSVEIHYAKQNGTFTGQDLDSLEGSMTCFVDALKDVEESAYEITPKRRPPILSLIPSLEGQRGQEKSIMPQPTTRSTQTFLPANDEVVREKEVNAEDAWQSMFNKNRERVLQYKSLIRIGKFAAAAVLIGSIGASAVFYFNEILPRLRDKTITYENSDILIGNTIRPITHPNTANQHQIKDNTVYETGLEQLVATRYTARIGDDFFSFKTIEDIPNGLSTREFQAQGFPNYIEAPLIFDNGVIGLNAEEVMKLGTRSYVSLSLQNPPISYQENSLLDVNTFSIEIARHLDELEDGLVDLQI